MLQAVGGRDEGLVGPPLSAGLDLDAGTLPLGDHSCTFGTRKPT